MTKMQNDLDKLEARDLGFARVRDAAFDAVYHLWLKRSDAGLTKKDLSEKLGRNRAWVTRAFAGPGNWTMRTFGELVGALDGIIEVKIIPIEDAIVDRNYCAYDNFLNNSDAPPDYGYEFSIDNKLSNYIFVGTSYPYSEPYASETVREEKVMQE